MKHQPARRAHPILAAAAVVHTRLAIARRQAREHPDRGDVVSTVIIVAGFAALAVAVYLAVKGKVHGWIEQIPGGTG